MITAPDDATPTTVPAELSAAHHRSRDAETLILAPAAEGANLHPALDVDDAAYLLDDCTGEHLRIAGAGTPQRGRLSASSTGR